MAPPPVGIWTMGQTPRERTAKGVPETCPFGL
jgi:hypothetical protein